jgi:hypothetical protein
MYNSPDGLLSSPQIETCLGYESSVIGAGSSSIVYGGDESPSFCRQPFFLPQHQVPLNQVYSNNLFNGE